MSRATAVVSAFRSRWLLAAALAAIVVDAPLASLQPHRVLLVYSNRGDFNTNLIIERALRSRLEAEFGDRVEFYVEYIEPARFQEPSYHLALSDFLRRKYENVGLDVIVGVARIALDFLLDRRQHLFPGVPVVTWGVRGASQRWQNEPNSTGVTAEVDLPGAIELMLRLQPQLERVICVVGTGAAEQRFLTEARPALDAETRVQITIPPARRFNEVLATLRSLPRDSAVLFLGMSETGDGLSLVSSAALERIAEASTVPVYGLVTSQLDAGIVGGKLLNQELITRHAAERVSEILRGTPVSELPVRQVNASVVMLDWARLQRWSVDAARIPADAVVLNRPRSPWEQYYWQMLAAITVLLIQSALIAGFLIQRARRRRVESEMREQQRELVHLNRVATVGELSGALAHELNQPLTAILSNAQAAQRFVTTTPIDVAEVRAALTDIVDADKRASQVINHVRGLLKKDAAHPITLNVNDVASEAIDLVRSELLARRVAISSRLASDLPPVLADRVQLQQVMLNLMLNAGDAMAGNSADERRLLSVVTSAQAGFVRIDVVDRGTGIPPDDVERVFDAFFSTKTQGLGLGLAICRSIVAAHGGRVLASNNAERGATFSVLIPAASTGRARVGPNVVEDRYLGWLDGRRAPISDRDVAADRGPGRKRKS
jgi:signal transduction histidine kinase